MKRAGIITLNGYHNFGNRLQNYAVEEIMKSLGFSVQTIKVSLRTTGMIVYDSFSTTLNKFWFKINRNKIRAAINTKNEKFITFSKENLTETDFSIEENNIPNSLSEEYDFFVTGSDQVWNPAYRVVSSIHFLQFAKKEQRIALSPSFGVSKIPEEKIELYREWIKGMHRLSVREHAGAQIIQELTGIEAPVLVDPTFVLTQEEWLAIAKTHRSKPNGKYLLTYFLGKISKNDQKLIKKIAKKHKMKVVNIAQISDLKYYDTDPSEFIDYISTASLVCTDSLHGSIFSILMKRPFLVYQRKDSGPPMYSRIDTLLEKFNLQDRKNDKYGEKVDKVLEINYKGTDELINFERQRILEYLYESTENCFRKRKK